MGYSPWGCKESNITEWLTFHFTSLLLIDLSQLAFQWHLFLFILIEITLIHKFINFMWMTLHSYSCIHWSMLTTKNLVSNCHHTVDHLCPFCSPIPSPLVTISVSKCLVLFGLLIFYFVYIPHMSEIIWHLPFSIWFISLSIILLRSIYMVANGKIPSILWLSSIPLCIYLSIHWWAIRLFLYLGCCK